VVAMGVKLSALNVSLGQVRAQIRSAEITE
jgi:hypothetical protein